MPIGSPQWMYASGEDFTLDQSLRFEGVDNTAGGAYLSRTFSASNRKTWTLSCWIKLGKVTGYRTIFAQKDSSSQNGEIYFDGTSNPGSLYWHLGNTDNVRSYSSPKLKDPSAWYHLVFSLDTTDSTAANRQRFYLNGEQITNFDGYAPAPSQNYEGNVNKAAQHEIGGRDGTNNFFNGHMAEVHFIDGTALTPTSFGETGDYGEWKPIEVSGLTYGTNGFYLDFVNKSTKHTLTANGDAQHDTAQQKIGATSIAFDGTTDYVQILNTGSSFDFGTSDDFTLECWVRPADVTGGQSVIDIRGSHGDYIQLYFAGSGVAVAGGNVNIAVVSSAVSANTWYHFAVVRNGGTITLYKDGTSIGTPDTSTGQIGGTDYSVAFGMYRTNAGGGGEAFNGFIDEIRISDSARYTGSFTPSTSAFTDDDDTLLLVHSDTSDASTTFTDSSGTLQGLGTDAAGSNHFTAHNFTAADQMLDTPTNNFCTMNPLFRGTASSGDTETIHTLSEGNLKIRPAHNCMTGVSIIPPSGKWYMEFYVYGTSAYGPMVGFFDDAYNRTDFNQDFGSMWKLYSRGASDELIWYAYPASAVSLGASSGTAFDVGDVMAMAWDIDSGKMWVAHNNVWYDASLGTTGNPSTGANTMATATTAQRANNFSIWLGSGDDTGSIMTANFGQDSSFAGEKTAQGNQDANGIGDFYYTPPTNFLALCTSNLPAVAVIPSENFNTVLYQGTGSSNNVTGVGFTPEMTVISERDESEAVSVVDILRGSGVTELIWGGTGVELDDVQKITAILSDGFTVGTSFAANHTDHPHVSWHWKAGGAGVANTVGSSDSVVSVNTDIGFSIVTYTGQSGAQTIGHGLGVVPEIVLVKDRTAAGDEWAMYHANNTAAPETDYLRFDNDAGTADNTFWNDTVPTATVFSVGDSRVTNSGHGEDYVAYCFHSVDGMTKVGSYKGNGNADGPFAYTGFRPAWILIRNTGSNHEWSIFDNKRNTYNTANLSSGTRGYAENTSQGSVDFLSNGFKMRASTNHTNESGETMVYLAFAETPFKYSNAR